MLLRRLLRFVVLAVALAALAGCAHKQAIDQANAYAQQGDWRAAYAQCERALEIDPDSAQAQACAADTRPKATNAALDDARSELSKRNYARALDHLDYIDGIHSEPAEKSEQLRADIRSAVEERLAGYIDAAEMETAYEFAGTAAQLYPDARFVEDAYQSCRAYFRDKAATAEQAGDFAAAIAAWDVIGTHESERSDEVDAAQTRLRSEWADTLISRADELEADDKLAGATVMYAKAFDLNGREKARVQLRLLTDQLARETEFGVRWKLEGPRDWTASFEESLTNALPTGIAAVATSPRLHAEFDLSSSDCSDAATDTSRASQRYVSGTRRVTNPDWDDTSDELESARSELNDTRSEKSELEHETRDAQRKVDEYRADTLAPIRRKLDSAWQRERRLTSSVESQQTMLESAEAKLSRLERREDADEEEIAAQKITVRTLRENLRKKQDRLEIARRERRDLEREANDAERELESRKRERDRVDADLAEMSRDVDALQREVESLERELDDTPRTIEQDVIDTFDYDVVTWTRTCTAEVEMEAKFADDGRESSTMLTGKASTTDDTHPAYPRYGVEKDPLVFETDDVELLSRVDRDLAGKTSGELSELAQAFWRRRTSEAIGDMKKRPHHAANLLLSVHLAAPEHLSDGDVTALGEHLVEHYEYAPMATITQRD
jgi:hypothetical protein